MKKPFPGGLVVDLVIRIVRLRRELAQAEEELRKLLEPEPEPPLNPEGT